MIGETPVLLRVEDFKHSCAWIAVEIGPANFVDFVCGIRDPSVTSSEA